VLKLATQSRHHLGGEEQVERGRDLSQPCHEHPEQAYLAVPEGPGAISGSSAWRLSISRSAIGTGLITSTPATWCKHRETSPPFRLLLTR
jgi:hypothetical protein